MKTRNGFISNSSSSSFIIATDDTDFKFNVEIDLSDYIVCTISNKEELDKNYKELEDEISYEEVLEYINRGQVLSIIDYRYYINPELTLSDITKNNSIKKVKTIYIH